MPRMSPIYVVSDHPADEGPRLELWDNLPEAIEAGRNLHSEGRAVVIHCPLGQVICRFDCYGQPYPSGNSHPSAN